MRARALSLAVALVAGVAGSTRAQMPPSELAEYAVVGLEGVIVKREARVTAGAVGALAGTVKLGRAARVTNVVAAPNVRVGLDARIGNLFCFLVSGHPPLPRCAAFTEPLIDPALLALPVAVPGSDDLLIPGRTGTAPLPPGSFRDIRVGAGGLLQLYGGDYSARSLVIGRGGRVICANDCRIAVLDTIRLRPRAGIGATTPARAHTARIDVAGTGPEPAFAARGRTVVNATVFAPGAAVVVGPEGSHRGALVGRTVTIGAGATLRGDSAL